MGSRARLYLGLAGLVLFGGPGLAAGRAADSAVSETQVTDAARGVAEAPGAVNDVDGASTDGAGVTKDASDLVTDARGLTSAAGDANPSPRSGAGDRAALTSMLRALDANAARIEASSNPAIVREAAATRAALAGALAGLGALSDEQVARVAEQVELMMGTNLALASVDGVGPTGASTLELEAPTQDDVAALEQLRSELDQVFATYETWAPLVPDGAQYLSFVADGRAMIADLTYEDLHAIRAQMDDIPNWQAVLAPDLTGLVELGAGPTGGVQGAIVDGARVDGTAGLFAALEYDRRPPIEAGDQCSDHALNLTYEQVVARMIAEAVLRYGSLALEFAADVMPDDIKITIFGTGVSIPNPFTLLVRIGQLVVNRVADGLAADLAVADYCTGVVHWKFMKLHSQSLIDRGQDILYQEMELHNRLTQRYNALDLTERELWKLQLQLAIEEDLLHDGPLADGSDENRMAIFQYVDTACFNPEELLPTPLPPFDVPVAPTPDDPIEPPDRYVPLPTVAPFVGPLDPREQCGLELVRRIVAETIQHNQQAGNDVHNAPALLAAGDSMLADRNFGQAYIRYRQAYRAAVKPDPSPN